MFDFQIFIKLAVTSDMNDFLKQIPINLALPPWSNSYAAINNLTVSGPLVG